MEETLEHNRSLETMEKLKKSINWNRIESILLSHYTVGTSGEGADAYPPLLLYKCMLLQKWFRIPSDPELETQINDRFSFRRFLGLALDQSSPDHSTFSRFRSRLSKNAMDQINSEFLRQFEQQGLTINEGIAIDARLVKSANRPISNDKIKELREKSQTPEGKLDKNGKPKKYSRNLGSDWNAKDENNPYYGLKKHASVDTKNGFILATILSPASEHDTNYLPYCTVFSCHTKQPIEKVYADKAYFGEPNRSFLAGNKIADGIMRKDTSTAKLTPYEEERNKQISKIRYIVEQYFGLSNLSDQANRARFPKIPKNNFDCWCRQAAFNIKRRLRILKMTFI